MAVCRFCEQWNKIEIDPALWCKGRSNPEGYWPSMSEQTEQILLWFDAHPEMKAKWRLTYEGLKANRERVVR